jgi:hypothetical protein
LYGVQVSRFSSVATQAISQLANYYADLSKITTNPYLQGLMHITFVVPVARVLATGFIAFVTAEFEYFRKAIDRSSEIGQLYKSEIEDFNDDHREIEAAAGKADPGDVKTAEEFWNSQSFFRRATHDVGSCWNEFVFKRQGPAKFFGVIAATVLTVPLFAYHFLYNNLHALATVNAMANGLLAVQPGAPATENLEAASGNALGSAMCYGNKVHQDNLNMNGHSTDEQSTYKPWKILYRHKKSASNDEEMITLGDQVHEETAVNLPKGIKEPGLVMDDFDDETRTRFKPFAKKSA